MVGSCRDFDPGVLLKDNVMAVRQPEVVDGEGSTVNADIACYVA